MGELQADLLLWILVNLPLVWILNNITPELLEMDIELHIEYPNLMRAKYSNNIDWQTEEYL